jgi:uncharacterized protein (DUF4415 family)
MIHPTNPDKHSSGKGVKVKEMRAEYDFSDSRSNPYAKKLRRQITIRLDNDVVDYFKLQSSKMGIPYQNLINHYLADCAQNEKTLTMSWS